MGEASLPQRTPKKQKATAILYCLGLLQLSNKTRDGQAWQFTDRTPSCQKSSRYS